VPNRTVAAACREFPDVFTGLGSVDPHKGDAAVARSPASPRWACAGSVSPLAQAFAPDDPAYQPVFAACSGDLLALFHTGTSGIGAGQPGRRGIRLDYAPDQARRRRILPTG
jgi:predicted TIM-barrel fold metal-dependent hydrolase